MMPRIGTQLLVIASTGLWLAAIGVGMTMIWNYQNSAGATSFPPFHWPADSQAQPVTGRAKLVMIAHPHCACARASIGELAVLIGGITASRGHSGDNEGRRAIVALLTAEGAARAETQVFGCSLVDNDGSCSSGEKICGK